MSPLARGLLIALVQVALVAGVGGKLLYDRETLPRVWARTTGVDPMLPIRGRYVSLHLVVQFDPGKESDTQATAGSFAGPVVLQVADGSLRATVSGAAGYAGWNDQEVQRVVTPAGPVWCLVEPVAFFLPEKTADPTRLAPGEELWAEVTVPRHGPPRPIRLETRPRQAGGAG